MEGVWVPERHIARPPPSRNTYSELVLHEAPGIWGQSVTTANVTMPHRATGLGCGGPSEGLRMTPGLWTEQLGARGVNFIDLTPRGIHSCPQHQGDARFSMGVPL